MRRKYRISTFFAIITVILNITPVVEGQVPTLDPVKTVNLATGEMQFNIPLANVRDATGRDFPITLAYQAGIRAYQPASEVGLGFAIPGCMITRKVILVPDDGTGIFRGVNTNCTNNQSLMDIVFGWVSTAFSIFISIVTCNPLPLFTGVVTWQIGMFMNAIHVNLNDFNAGGEHLPQFDYKKSTYGYFKEPTNIHYDLPDVYMINTPFLSGEMVYSNYNEVTQSFVFKMKSSASSKATLISYKNNYFNITLSDGTKLYFTKRETGRSETHIYGNNSGCDYDALFTAYATANAWYLTKVCFPDFQGTTPEGEPTSGGWIAFDYLIARPSISGSYNVFQNCNRTLQADNESSEVVDIYTDSLLYISKIRTSTQYAKFNYLFDRLDIMLQDKSSGLFYLYPRLESITVNAVNGPEIRKISFVTDYLLRPFTNQALKGSDLTQYKCLSSDGTLVTRTGPVSLPNPNLASLTLKAVRINPAGSAGNGLQIVPDYDATTNYSNAIASRYPVEIENRDIWGYYKPGLASGNDFNPEGQPEKTAKSDAWSMRSLNLPNGMKITWNYEPNRYACVNGGYFSTKDANGVTVNRCGGGIRVKNMTVFDGIKPAGNRYDFFYTMMDAPGKLIENPSDLLSSSGEATVEPYCNIVGKGNDPRHEKSRGGFYTGAKVVYRRSIVAQNYDFTNKVAPYGYVVNDFYTTHDFQNMGRYSQVDYSWKRGFPKSITYYKKNDKIVSRKEFEYKFVQEGTLSIDKSLGRYLNSENATFDLRYNLDDNDYLGLLCYGSVVLQKVTETKDGVASTTQNKYAFDFPDATDRFKTSQKKIQKSILPSIPTTPSIPPAGVPYVVRNNGHCLLTNSLGDKLKPDLISVISFQQRQDGKVNKLYMEIRVAKDITLGYTESFDVSWSQVFLYTLFTPQVFDQTGKAFTIDKVNGIGMSGADLVVNYSVLSGGYGNQKHCKVNEIETNTSNAIIFSSLLANQTGFNSNACIDADDYSNCCAEFVLDVNLDWKQIGGFWPGYGEYVYVGLYGDRLFTIFENKDIDIVSDLDGQPNQIIETGSDGKQRITTPIPAYWQTPYAGMKTANMLTQPCQTIVYETAASSPSNARSSQVTRWRNWSGMWRPCSSYVWKEQTDAQGKPAAALPAFDFASPYVSSSAWQFTGGITRYNDFGQVTEATNGNNIPSTTVYGTAASLPIASIKPSKFDACGVFTCDYDLQQGGYFDLQNGWAYCDGTMPSGAICLVESTCPHFGQKSLHVKNCKAAVRTAAVYSPNDKITRSAWVRPVNTNPIRFAACLVVNNVAYGNIYYDYVYDAPHGLVADGSWQLVQFTIDISKPNGTPPPSLPSGIDGNGDRLYMWIGNNSPTESAAEFYIDDIRFYPADALVTTTYYDTLWQKPILTVGANNNPGKLVKFDGFGRESEVWKIDKISSRGAGSDQILQRKNYHLMGEN